MTSDPPAHPCPFCQNTELYVHQGDIFPHYSVRCPRCRAQGPQRRREQAVAAWNAASDAVIRVARWGAS